jgi:outer membrane immunogenic protein
VPASSPWTAIYVGGFVGASVTTQSFDESGANQFFSLFGAGTPILSLPLSDPETPFGFSANKGSFTGGILVGAGYQFQGLVFGAEADFAWKRTELKGTQTAGEDATYSYTPYSCINGAGDCVYDTASATRTEAFSGQVRQGWDASVRVRLGALLTPRILVYATGGGAAGAVDSSFSYSAITLYNYESAPGAPIPITHTTSANGSWTDLRIGWTAGGGIEALVAPNWRVRAEYRFTDLGRFTKEVPLTRVSSDPVNLPNTGSLNSVVNLNAGFHTVRLGFAYGF